VAGNSQILRFSFVQNVEAAGQQKHKEKLKGKPNQTQILTNLKAARKIAKKQQK